jgi:hypothetical protein
MQVKVYQLLIAAFNVFPGRIKMEGVQASVNHAKQGTFNLFQDNRAVNHARREAIVMALLLKLVVGFNRALQARSIMKLEAVI